MNRGAAVLLAAGESRRMGQPKALLPWAGEPLVAYQVRQMAEAGLHPIIVVVGHRAAEVAMALGGCPETTIVENRLYADGKTTSIRTGVGALPPTAEAVLILAVDQPRRSDTLLRLVSAHFEAGALISVPAHQGRTGHPPVFSMGLKEELLNLSEERQGLRDTLLRHRESIVEVPFSAPDVLWNLNTPDEYRHALETMDNTTTFR